MTNPIHIIKKHGGARKGAGRKPGLGGKRNRISRSVSLPIGLWAKIDRERGKMNRSQWIEVKLNDQIHPRRA